MKSWQTESSKAKLQKQINKPKKKKESTKTDKRQGCQARHGRIRTKQYTRHRNVRPVSIGNLCGPLKVTRRQWCGRRVFGVFQTFKQLGTARNINRRKKKKKTGWGRVEEREREREALSPVPPLFFLAFSTLHHSKLSERLEQLSGALNVFFVTTRFSKTPTNQQHSFDLAVQGNVFTVVKKTVNKKSNKKRKHYVEHMVANKTGNCHENANV